MGNLWLMVNDEREDEKRINYGSLKFFIAG